MRPFWALIRKQLHESRWTLGVSASALFGLGWLSVYVTSLNESRIVQAARDRAGRRSHRVDAAAGDRE